jgi:hypothetical protein
MQNKSKEEVTVQAADLGFSTLYTLGGLASDIL